MVVSHPPDKQSIWKTIGSGFKKVVSGTGAGLKYIYKTGQEHSHYTLPVLNGLVGDKLAANKDSRAIQMSFRSDGKDVEPTALIPDNLKSLHSGTVVIFVHGLMADEVFWQTNGTEQGGYGPALKKDAGILPLYVRYNTGLHISENGRLLSDLIQKLVDSSPAIGKIHLIAHSMGGLVSRSAGYYAGVQKQNWTQKLASVVLLGVPNDGSYLEKLGHLTTFVLRQVWSFHTRLIAKIADERSNGIKDLRWGFMVDEDWASGDSDGLLSARRTPVPPLPNTKYYVLVGSLTETEIAVVSTYFGDGLVGTASANGQIFKTRDSASDLVEFRVFPGTSHVGLLAHPEVYQCIHKIQVNQSSG